MSQNHRVKGGTAGEVFNSGVGKRRFCRCGPAKNTGRKGKKEQKHGDIQLCLWQQKLDIFDEMLGQTFIPCFATTEPSKLQHNLLLTRVVFGAQT